jgi:hypothetical protein
MGSGQQAAAEFRKLLNHRGMTQNWILAAIARLQLGRALVQEGDVPKGRSSYKDFLDLWHTADSDAPLLKQAKSEYATLQ